MTILQTFKYIPEYSNYKINNIGDVYLFKNNKEIKLSPYIGTHGYYSIRLRGNVSKQFLIHRLVAITFIPNPENKPCVNHINGIKTDNRVENLEWCTYSENNKHAYKEGLKTAFLRDGIKNPSSKLTEEQVLEIRAIGSSISQRKIAKKYNVHQSLIYLILKRKNWTHI